jgi:predicted nucleotidyltransferase
MTFWNRLLGQNDVLRRQDPCFGWMEYVNGFWIRPTSANQSALILLIEADQNGPTEAQRLFYLRIQPRLAQLTQSAIDLIRKEAPEHGFRQFVLTTLEIPHDKELEEGSWVLEFVSEPDAQVIHRVGFEAQQPAYYGEEE